VGRKLGQHFLVRQSILRRIAEAVCPEPCDLAVEIGPGKGALTEHLLSRTPRLVAIEVDSSLITPLRRRFSSSPGLEILHADVLKTDLSQWGPVTVAGNLPYYITSPIIEKVLALGPLLRQAVFLIQKEVADRITAQTGSRAYGYLTVQTQLLSEARTLLRVPPQAFRPPPKVDSAVIRLTPRPEPLVTDTGAFLRFTSFCFRQKRKTLRNNLVSVYPSISDQPESGQRAEQLSLEQLLDLHHRLTR
jgi:16S rRNA (adenine1518-N6/adenine1519-N6)-dimethyltransferase